MQAQRYRMRRDLLSRILTLLFATMAALVVAYFFLYSSGSYLPAWLTILGVTIALIALIQIPRAVVISTNYIEVMCVLKVVRIAKDEITEISQLPAKYSKWLLPIPILSVWGIPAYFGIYLDIKRFRVVRLYATERRNLVLIKRNGRSNTIISIDRPSHLIELFKTKTL